MEAEHPQPSAVIVMLDTQSGAVNLTELLIVELSALPGAAQYAIPGENVKITSSPTPIVLRSRFVGFMATV
jgi:hypothetical protein